jgi:hypothetical protein
MRDWSAILFMFVRRYGRRDRLVLEDWGDFFFLIDNER